MRGTERALEMHLDDRVPLLLCHREQHAVAKDPGVVDEYVEGAERVDRLGDEASRAVPRADVVGVGGRLTTGGPDLVDDLLGWTHVGAHALP